MWITATKSTTMKKRVNKVEGRNQKNLFKIPYYNLWVLPHGGNNNFTQGQQAFFLHSQTRKKQMWQNASQNVKSWKTCLLVEMSVFWNGSTVKAAALDHGRCFCLVFGHQWGSVSLPGSHLHNFHSLYQRPITVCCLIWTISFAHNNTHTHVTTLLQKFWQRHTLIIYTAHNVTLVVNSSDFSLCVLLQMVQNAPGDNNPNRWTFTNIYFHIRTHADTQGQKYWETPGCRRRKLRESWVMTIPHISCPFWQLSLVGCARVFVLVRAELWKWARAGVLPRSQWSRCLNSGHESQVAFFTSGHLGNIWCHVQSD